MIDNLYSPNDGAAVPKAARAEGIAALKEIYDAKADAQSNAQANATEKWQQHAGVLDKVRYAFTGGISQKLQAKLNGTAEPEAAPVRETQSAPTLSWFEKAKNAVGNIGQTINAKINGAIEYAKTTVDSIRQSINAETNNIMDAAHRATTALAPSPATKARARQAVAGGVLAAQAAGCAPTPRLTLEPTEQISFNQDYATISHFDYTEAERESDLEYNETESVSGVDLELAPDAPVIAIAPKRTRTMAPIAASPDRVITSAKPTLPLKPASITKHKPEKQPAPIATTVPFKTQIPGSIRPDHPNIKNVEFAGKIPGSKMPYPEASQMWRDLVDLEIQMVNAIFKLTKTINPDDINFNNNAFLNLDTKAKTEVTLLDLKTTNSSISAPIPESGRAINPRPPRVRLQVNTVPEKRRPSDTLEILHASTPAPSDKFKRKMRAKFDDSGTTKIGKPSEEIDENGHKWKVVETRGMGVVYTHISPTSKTVAPEETTPTPSERFKSDVRAKFDGLKEASIGFTLQEPDEKGNIWVVTKTRRLGYVYNCISIAEKTSPIITAPYTNSLRAQHALPPIQ